MRQLHELLAPHMLRRVKKDVLAGKIPPKKEFIVRVEMTPTQRKYFKAAGGGVVYTHTRHVFALDSRLDGGEVVLFLLHTGLYRYCTTHDERQKKHRRAKARRRGGVN